ncbi:DUF1538 domain-containing protein [Roseospira marina]|uniref:DUF1538 domain-containing protein n=1 Tax=Roseospira marina TaxID=140057 RepID=A0A5M6IG42_9PROT|nr:DUF1538 domain-containing protein [Roseospira marina]KAA5607223.1 DUF1538 domain-containing protein [Roseospira marina]MBB4312626.1 hypothetical protein [Roseospira marina]MBB5085358.1 hypothetical protein [Roseospira marina]
MATLIELTDTLWTTVLDVAPILLVLVLFQVLVLRQRVPHLRRMVLGFVYVVLGLDLFLVGLEMALFPLGDIMARQLTDPAFLRPDGLAVLGWRDYLWVYAFAAAIGFSTTIAEPALIAVSLKVSEVSGGSVRSWGLRLAVAAGVAIGVSLGALRIVTGWSLPLLIVIGYVVVILQTVFAPRQIIPLAYDSGGVTTSTVTVPLVTALGLGLASSIPGRSPLIDGFGLIALASLFPMITVMGYAQVGDMVARRAARRKAREES